MGIDSMGCGKPKRFGLELLGLVGFVIFFVAVFWPLALMGIALGIIYWFCPSYKIFRIFGKDI